MSRTEGIHLPRIPIAHAKAVSPSGIQPLFPKSPRHLQERFSPLTEPNYTAFIGSPRQDLPQQVFCDAAMFDDVFDKQGKLLSGRNTVKIASPLTSQQYNSLHDPHCRRLFLNNCALREHLINLGLLTEDLHVVASTQEQRQRIRAHELLERKEQLIKKLEEREQKRIASLHKTPSLPYRLAQSMNKNEERVVREHEIERTKAEKLAKIEQDKREKEMECKRERRRRLQQLLQQINLWDQTKRNAARAQQEIAEISAYEKQYGWTAVWHRDSDRIHNRMILLSRTKWAKPSKQKFKEKKNVDHVLEFGSTKSSPPSLTPPSGHTSLPIEPGLPVSSKHQETTAAPVHKKVPQEEEGSAGKKEVLEDSTVNEAEKETKTDEQKDEPPAIAEKEVSSHTEGESVQATPAEQDQHLPVEEEVNVPKEGKESIKKTMSEGTQGVSTTTLLNPNRSAIELSRFFTDILASVDFVGNGFISLDQFVRVTSSRDLGLPLDQQEILYIAGQVDIYGNGWIPVIQAASVLPGLITVLLQQRMQLELEQYGQFIEEQWCQLQSQTVGIIYLDKTTGLVQRERPSEFRPYLRNSPFEQMIVELFNSADMNQDGCVDYEEFVEFTQLPLVSGRVYTEQAQEVIEKFVAQIPPEGYMSLEQFVSIADLLISMIYKNSYPTQEWLELQSQKCGSFHYNPSTGETRIQDQIEEDIDLPQSSQPESAKRSRRRRRRRKSVEDSDNGGGTGGGPPPLRRRSLTSHESTGLQNGPTKEGSTSVSEADKEDRHSPVENGVAEELVQEVAKQLQVGLRIIEPILEEKEEDLEDSNSHLATEQACHGPIGGEQDFQLEDSKASFNKVITEETQASAAKNDVIESSTGLKELDTISRALGEVIARRKHAQANGI